MCNDLLVHPAMNCHPGNKYAMNCHPGNKYAMNYQPIKKVQWTTLPMCNELPVRNPLIMILCNRDGWSRLEIWGSLLCYYTWYIIKYQFINSVVSWLTTLSSLHNYHHWQLLCSAWHCDHRKHSSRVYFRINWHLSGGRRCSKQLQIPGRTKHVPHKREARYT